MIDFDRFSLDTLLKMARDVDLIEHYEKDSHCATIVVGSHRHVVSHRVARTFLRDLLIDWWQRQAKMQQEAGA